MMPKISVGSGRFSQMLTHADNILSEYVIFKRVRSISAYLEEQLLLFPFRNRILVLATLGMNSKSFQ